jgi:hypothetical protein
MRELERHSPFSVQADMIHEADTIKGLLRAVQKVEEFSYIRSILKV